MSILPTIFVSDGNKTIRINASDEADWAARGFVALDVPSEQPAVAIPVRKKQKK